MSEIFQNIPKIEYGGADSRDPLKFKYYDLSKAQLRKKLVEKIDEEKLDLLISRELFDRDYTTLDL